MNFSYTIEGFIKTEGLLVVKYIPEDTSKETITRHIPINDTMTQQEIDQRIINRAPIENWARNFSPEIFDLVGKTGQANSSQIDRTSEAIPGILTYPDGSTSVPPPPMPDDGKTYKWDNPTWSWVEIPSAAS